MATYTLGSAYDIFIFITLVFKILFIIISLRLKYFELTHSKTREELLSIQKREKYVDFFALGLIYILIIYIFWPSKNINTIKIGHHERILIFAAGILGILHLDWDIPKKLLSKITGKVQTSHNVYAKYNANEPRLSGRPAHDM